MAEPEDGSCPACGRGFGEPPRRDDHNPDLMFYDCLRCGKFGLEWRTGLALADWVKRDDRNATVFGHMVRRMQTAQEWPLVDIAAIERIIASPQLPTAQEQADILVRWLGEHLPGPGERVIISFD